MLYGDIYVVVAARLPSLTWATGNNHKIALYTRPCFPEKGPCVQTCSIGGPLTTYPSSKDITVSKAPGLAGCADPGDSVTESKSPLSVMPQCGQDALTLGI